MEKALNIILRILGILLLISATWEEKAPDLETILGKSAKNRGNGKIAILCIGKSINNSTQ